MTTRTVFADRQAAQGYAEKLQRQGMTLSEIAQALQFRQEAVVHMLYWQLVRS